MCSIPWLPTQGSEIPVLITRVNLNPKCGLVELWVNINDGRKNIYEKMRNHIQNPSSKFKGSEGKPGDLCLVCISDTWHRARIVTIDGENYNVLLIDQGKPHISTNDALAWDQSDSFLLPPETESCILANVVSIKNKWPEKATNFLGSLPGKTFKGLVQHVLMSDRIILLDIPVVSKFICKCGVAKKMAADEFKCLVLKCLDLPKGEDYETCSITQEQDLIVRCQLDKHDQYFYPELLTGTYETVEVTEVINPQKVFCKLLIFSKAVKILSEQIHQHYQENSDLGEVQPKTCRQPCAAKSSDGRWYRSFLKQDMPSDGAVEVFHVDQGITELVPVGDVKPLHGKFLRMPVFTYPCCLDGAKDDSTGLSTDQTDHLRSLLLHQTVMVRFNHHNVCQNVYHITLYAANDLRLKTAQDSDVQNEPITCLGIQNKVNGSVDGSPEEILPNRKNQVNGRTDDISTSGTDNINSKGGTEHPYPIVQINGHLPSSFPSEVEKPCVDDVFKAGTCVNVKVSCIESLQKFWCQTTENANSLKVLMQNLQNYYASAHPEPFVDSVCVARNPDNGMWYRARIIASHHSPLVDVRYIDYGQTSKVHLRDVRPIDPAFLRLSAQAFQCCLFNLKNPTDPTTMTWTDSALTEFLKFVDSAASSNTGFKCVVKSVMLDEEGLPKNVVDIETASDSASKFLAQTCAQDEPRMQIPAQVSSDAYRYSAHNIEVNGEEKVRVTYSESVNHFYCQLDRNSTLLKKVMENVQQLAGQPRRTDHPLGLNSICFARYTDNQWYRGQVVRVSPKLTVKFVDYGHTLEVNESDVCPVPSAPSIIMSVPVQAVPLGLFDVPPEVPQKINQWFADHATDHSFTISVVAKGPKGKLIVELFDGFLNVNVTIRERILKMTQGKPPGAIQQTDQQLSNGTKCANGPVEDCLMQDLETVSSSAKMKEHNEVKSTNGKCAGNERKTGAQSIANVSEPEIKHDMAFDGERKTLDVIVEDKETLGETFLQNGHSDSETTELTLPACPDINKRITYKSPNLSFNKTVEVCASHFDGPHYFWCQYTHTENLSFVSKLAQEVGQAQQDIGCPMILEPGSPCLALFSRDSQWYRAQVIQQTDSKLHVLFIDYGNESDVDVKNVRPLPQSLLEMAPQAFLCSLSGFDNSKGAWDDNVCDVFYSLVADKPLRVTVFDREDHSDLMVPQYAVQILCENLIVNEEMQKYWKPAATEHIVTENPETENLPQEGQTVSTHFNVSKGKVNNCMYRHPNVCRKQDDKLYASCISDPHFFWCQYANTEELNKVSQLAQEAGRAQQDMMFSETLGPGSPCLALFSGDEQWYRALVIKKSDDEFHVVFIDYGNESDVGINNVRPLTQSLLEEAPLAFLCCLNGFDDSSGSWDDNVYDKFYSVLMDKPLKLTVVNTKDHPAIAVPHYAVEIECEGVAVNAAMHKYWKPAHSEPVLIEIPQKETVLQEGQNEGSVTHLSVSQENPSACLSEKPKMPQNKTHMVFASCIAAPNFFWCQYASTEELNKVSQLAQEAGRAQQDMVVSKALGPGSPCLALFSSDEQWYRAQVISRADGKYHVVFIDYGNESDVDIKNVRRLPQSLLEEAPLAFLCSLNGFDDPNGSWDDNVYDDFYNLLVDKPLKLTVFSTKKHPEIAIPQYTVEIECAGVAVNAAMQKYWKPALIENPQKETVLKDGQTGGNATHLSVSQENVSACRFKKPKVSKNKTHMVFASCIAEPNFFWCQYSSTEELNKVSQLAKEAGRAQQDMMFSMSLGPGSPCLALFSSDEQWYRAQVINKVDDTLHVVFMDYGNESDVDIKNVRPLPQILLEKVPLAFLCTLNGFEKSQGSWDDNVYDDFYNLLVDKPLKLTVFNMDYHSEIAVPQYAVEVECDGAVVNTLMEKYWKGRDTARALAENVGSVNQDKCSVFK